MCQQFYNRFQVVQILVRDKLQNLSGSARKILLAIVESIVMHSKKGGYVTSDATIALIKAWKAIIK